MCISNFSLGSRLLFTSKLLESIICPLCIWLLAPSFSPQSTVNRFLSYVHSNYSSQCNQYICDSQGWSTPLSVLIFLNLSATSDTANPFMPRFSPILFSDLFLSASSFYTYLLDFPFHSLAWDSLSLSTY